MVSKSKLKMALAGQKGIDFTKQHQKKMAKLAQKSKNKKADEWEDVSDEEDEGGVALEHDEEEEEEDEEEESMFDLEAIDDTDESDDDEDEAEDDDDNDDDEDIPMSDIEDLPEEDKEDLVPHQRLTINNTAALKASLKRIGLPLSTLSFSEHQSVTSSAPTAIADVSDDLGRELAFYKQALEAARRGRAALRAEGVAFRRPTDYFAEMVKADAHMDKIKAKLIEEASNKKAAAEARRLRDLKKFGKKVQVAKQQERDRERKQTLEKIKVLKRKRQDAGSGAATTDEPDMFDVALEDATTPGRKRAPGGSGPNLKRQKKDAKYGHGGKKRFAKSGDAVSSGDLSGFNVNKMRGRAGGGAPRGKKGGAAKRPGKSRRAKM